MGAIEILLGVVIVFLLVLLGMMVNQPSIEDVTGLDQRLNESLKTHVKELKELLEDSKQ